MSFHSQVRNLKVVVFGYVRRIEESSTRPMHTPVVVNELIIAYAKGFFAWYRKKHGDGYGFFEENPFQAEKITNLGYSFLLSANCLSSEMCKKFEWEITLIERKLYDAKISLMIGFIAHPMEKNISNMNSYFIGKVQFGVLAYCANSCLKTFGRDGVGIQFAKQNKRYDIKDGDRFCFRFDFETRKCSFGYNDVFTADVFINIPSKIIPAVSLYRPMKIACTKWNAIFDG